MTVEEYLWLGLVGRRDQYLFEVVYFQRQLLQCEQDELQKRRVGGGFGVGQPSVEQFIAPNSNKPELMREITLQKVATWFGFEMNVGHCETTY